MATDGPDPPPCDPEIFARGKIVCGLTGSSNAVEGWVKRLAKMAHAKVDWHYVGGRARVLHLGGEASRKRVFAAFEKLRDSAPDTIFFVSEE